MPQNFLACDREQVFLMPPDVREWLPEGHLAWFVVDAVGEMNLAAFDAAYRADGHGRAAYDPAMMVALLLYAYARGLRSSRAIERAWRGGRRVPRDRRAPAARSRDAGAIRRAPRDGGRRTRSVRSTLCVQAGLARVGVVAIDGTKLSANASRDASVDYDRIAREIVQDARATDAAEDEQFGEARGDELPPELRDGPGPARLVARGQAPPG